MPKTFSFLISHLLFPTRNSFRIQRPVSHNNQTNCEALLWLCNDLLAQLHLFRTWPKTLPSSTNTTSVSRWTVLHKRTIAQARLKIDSYVRFFAKIIFTSCVYISPLFFPLRFSTFPFVCRRLLPRSFSFYLFILSNYAESDFTPVCITIICVHF